MEPFRPKSVRPLGRVASVGWLLSAVGCLLPIGCNNGKQLQRDLITRELRLQEDEIYRLEDYLEEYQRKVCALRKENRELKEQIAGETERNGDAAAEPPELLGGEHSLLDLPDDPAPEPPRPGSETTDDRFVPPDVPRFEFGTPADPPTPSNGSAATPLELPGPAAGDPLPSDSPPTDPLPRGNEPPPFEPGPPMIQPIETDAPPLPEEIIAPTPMLESPTLEPLSFEADIDELTPIDQLLQAERMLPINNVTGAPPLAPQAPGHADRLTITALPGPAEPDGQRTLAVGVAAYDAAGEPVRFAGEASVMLRVAGRPGAGGPPRKIARWDFVPTEVAASTTDSGREDRLSFLVALPPAAPTGTPIELWVRLVDNEGAKTLGVTQIALEAAGSDRVAGGDRAADTGRAAQIDGSVEPASWSEPVGGAATAEPSVSWQTRGKPTDAAAQVARAAKRGMQPSATTPASGFSSPNTTGRDTGASRPVDLGFSFEP
ncbi:MAG: hypothetical protein AAF596_09650 [Planctomycetota bacterium]